MNKNKWIILISVVVAVALATVLLVVMLGDTTGGKEQGGTGTPSDTSMTDTQPAPTDNTAEENDNDGMQGIEGSEVQVDIDMGEEEIEDDMVIDFDDLLAAAGK